MAKNTQEAIVIKREAIAILQLSEWVLQMIQKQFPRMDKRLLLEELGDRKIILNLLFLLYNYQCSKVGITSNHILNTFMSDTSDLGNVLNMEGIPQNCWITQSIVLCCLE